MNPLEMTQFVVNTSIGSMITNRIMVIFDPGVESWESLAAGVIPGTEVVVLHPQEDGVAQITQLLATRCNIEVLHIISHGEPGCLYLGSTRLATDTLDTYSPLVQQWRNALTPNADILIYGCNVASSEGIGNGEQGLSMVECGWLMEQGKPSTINPLLHRLHQLTGANIAASANLTGNPALGGDWELEITLGQGKFVSAFTPKIMETYSSVLSNTVDFDVLTAFNIDGITNRHNGVTDSTQSAIDRAGYNLITQSFANTASGRGLPDNGLFAANSFHPAIQLLYRNANDGNNLRLINSATGSFNFSVTPNTYSEVHIAALSSEGNSDLRLNFTYSDGTTAASSVATVPDWYDEITQSTSVYYLLDGMDRSTSSGTFQAAKDPALLGMRFANPNPTKPVTSISVEKTNSPGFLSFLGATGVLQSTASTEPATEPNKSSSDENIFLSQQQFQDYLTSQNISVEPEAVLISLFNIFDALEQNPETTPTAKVEIEDEAIEVTYLGDSFSLKNLPTKLQKLQDSPSSAPITLPDISLIGKPTVIVKNFQDHESLKYEVWFKDIPGNEFVAWIFQSMGVSNLGLANHLKQMGNINLGLAEDKFTVQYPGDITIPIATLVPIKTGFEAVDGAIASSIQALVGMENLVFSDSELSLSVDSENETTLALSTKFGEGDNKRSIGVEFSTDNNFKFEYGKDEITLASLFKGWASGPGDILSLGLTDLKLILASYDDKDDGFSKGLNLSGKLDFQERTDPISKFFRDQVYVNSLEAALQIGTEKVKFEGKAKTDKPLLEIGEFSAKITEMGVGLKGDLSKSNLSVSVDSKIALNGYDPSQQNEPELSLSGGVSFEPESITANFALDTGSNQAWIDPFGLKGVELRNFGIQAGFGETALDNIGIRGDLKYGSIDMDGAFSVDLTDSDRIALLLTLNNPVSLMGLIAGPINPFIFGEGAQDTILTDTFKFLDDVIEVEADSLKDVDDKDNDGDTAEKLPFIEFVPFEGVEIAGKTLEKGLGINASVKAWGAEGALTLSADYDTGNKQLTGLNADLSLSGIDLGFLKIGGADINDPELNLKLGVDVSGNKADLFYLEGDGRIEILGDEVAKADFKISENGINIKDLDWNFYNVIAFDIDDLNINVNQDNLTQSNASGKAAIKIFGEDLANAEFSLDKNKLFVSGQLWNAKAELTAVPNYDTLSQIPTGFEANLALSGIDLGFLKITGADINDPELNLSLGGDLSGKSSSPIYFEGDGRLEFLGKQVAKTEFKISENSISIKDLDWNFYNVIDFDIDDLNINVNRDNLTQSNASGKAAIKIFGEDLANAEFSLDKNKLFVSGQLWNAKAELTAVPKYDTRSQILTGFEANLAIPKIDLGFLQITGADINAPGLNLRLGGDLSGNSSSHIYFEGDGRLEFLGKQVAKTEFKISENSINIKDLDLNLFNVVDIDINDLNLKNDLNLNGNPDGINQYTGSGAANIKVLGEEIANATFSLDNNNLLVSGERRFNILGYDVWLGVEVSAGKSNVVTLNAKTDGLFDITKDFNLSPDLTEIESIYDWIEGLVAERIVEFVDEAIQSVEKGWNFATETVFQTWTDAGSLVVDAARQVANFFAQYLPFGQPIMGSNNDDLLNGWSNSDLIYGEGGNDTITGEDENDTLYGGPGNDQVSGGPGNDGLDGGEGSDRLYGDAGNDLLLGGDGNDLLHGGDGDDSLHGGGGSDELHGDAGNDYLYGGDGNDRLRGGDGDDILEGNAGNDWLDGDAGRNVIFGGDGDDRLYGGGEFDYLEGGRGRDLLDGQEGDDILNGGEGNDRLYGNSGNDLLMGGSGNDEIHGYLGNDTIYGDLPDSSHQVATESNNDILYGQQGHDLIYGGDGNDTIFGEDNGKQGQTYDGYSDNDTLLGGKGNDYLFGGLGNDSLMGEEGDDYLDGSKGNDYLHGAEGNNILHGGDGNDTLVAGSGNDNLSGGADNDILFAGAGNDNLRGAGGDDYLIGEDGEDTIDGGDGNDTLYGGGGNDILQGGAGNDLLIGGDGNDTLDGGDGNDRIEGGAGTDALKLSGNQSDYTFQQSRNSWTIKHNQSGEIKTVTNVEQFIDDAGFFNPQNLSVSNGPIAGATVFVDTNYNFQPDKGELQTTTDNNGEYELDALDLTTLDRNGDGEIEASEAQIVAIGGIDTTTGLPTTIPLISPIGSNSGIASTTSPLSTLKAVFSSQGLGGEDVEGLLNKIVGFSLDSLSQSLDDFDPYAGIGENNSSAINITSGHIKVMNVLQNGTKYLEAAGYLGNSQIQVIIALGEVLQNSETYDLSKPNELHSLFTHLSQKLNLGVTNETVTAVSELVGQSNQLVDNLVAQALSRSVSDVLPSINPIKKAVYSTLPEVTQKLVKGEITAAESQTQLQELLNADTFLVQYALNENRTVSVTASNNLAEGGNSNGQFVITLGEAAPSQGLKILYTLSGTATLGQDYHSSSGLFGEINIAPGATEGIINLAVIDDAFPEQPESVTINLKYVGDGYVLDPVAGTAIIQIDDNDAGNSATGETGMQQTGTFGNDVLTGDAGNDTLDGSYGQDLLQGKAGNDQLRGGAGDDTVLGGEGNDNIEGNFGADFLQGYAGDDLISGGADSDYIEGNEGNDQVQGDAGDDQLYGNTGNDLVSGGSGNDILNGNEDNDWLLGAEGEDILIGGAGVDLLNGGDGADVFYYNAPSEGGDLILDFDPSQGDKIQIFAPGFGTNSLADFTILAGTVQFKGQEIALIQNNGQTYNHFANLGDIIQLVTEPTAQPAPGAAEVSIDMTPGVATVDLVANPATTILDDVIQRGQIKISTDSASSEFDIQFARTLAAALFGDANKVEWIVSNFPDTFTQVADGTVDLSSPRSTQTLGRDATLNIDFSPLYFYDHQAVLVRKDSGIETAIDLAGRTVGVIKDTTSLGNLQNLLSPQGVEFVSKTFVDFTEVIAAYDRGEIDAYTIDRALITERLSDLSDPENHRLLDVEFSKEPIALILPENDSQWADVVRWVNYVPIQAEEFGITSQNIDQFIAANTDENPNNDSAPAIRRFLGIEGDLGATLGLPNNFAVNVIKQVGNYDEIYQRHFPGLERDRNLLWTDGGLLYSPPFSGSIIDATLVDNDDRNLLAEVLQRGTLKLGLPGNNPGFALKQENDEYVGFDVDLGRAIAAALFGDPTKMEIQVQPFRESFANTANGVVDVSAMGITQNLVRDAAMGVDFSPTYLYTGQGVLVRENSGISILPALNGRRVGTLEGATSLQNLQDALSEFGGTFIPVKFATNDQMFAAYDRGEIDAVSTDLTILSGRIPTLSNPEQHRILDDVLSKEPLGLITDENQSDWADVVRWVYNALVQAEELGITSANIDEFIASNTDGNSANDSNAMIRQFLGLEGNIGEALGLANDFAVKAIKAVGNYGEIYDRHFNSNVLRRDSNALSSEFGLQYALPTGAVGSSSRLNVSTVLFDADYYLAQYPDVAEAVANGTLPSAIAHFTQSGLAEGRLPSAFFAETYLKDNPDVAEAMANGTLRSALEHFLKSGFAEGRVPSDAFADFEMFYLSQNADAAAAVANGTYSNGLEHLVMGGLAQGANPFPQFEMLAKAFDANYYLAQNVDIAEVVQNGVFRSAMEHFVHFGMSENRIPSKAIADSFDAQSYLAQNADVAEAVQNGVFGSGLQHYVIYGMAEGRIGKAIAVNPEANLPEENPVDEAIATPTSTDILTGLDDSTIANPEVTNPEVDSFIGQPGADTFILGDANSVYYLNLPDAEGGKQYATIANFNSSEDVIQLHNSAADYQLAASPEGLPPGTAIYYKQGDRTDLVGVIAEVSSLALEENYFSFV
ncbi:DUF4347 domain-containing protein [Laspinema sp. D1]|uniref:DUF4347 domain-containing protein n=1 Tax=Laspinema palackyanum D2a TaxID=2953684 RepID=A0ABT2MT96_9CYAN|nr:DUF4347 domain-containing protein [Laspinema sp. D2a]